MGETLKRLVASDSPRGDRTVRDMENDQCITLIDVGSADMLQELMDAGHVVWTLAEDGKTIDELVFDGEDTVLNVREAPVDDNVIAMATTTYVDAIAEAMVSEVELLASSVADAMPENQDLQLAVKRFNNKTRIARAAIASKDPETMAVLRDYLSDNEANNAVTLYMYDDGLGVMR